VPTDHADLVVTGARVYTARHDAAGTARPADAVAVRGDRIVAVGGEDDVRGLVGSATRVVDARGGLVLPGFQDSHVHAPFAGRNRLRVWLNELSGKQAYLDAIAAYAAANPEEPWILGGGWAMEYFPGGTPHREDLDAVVPDRPVFLFNRDVHGAWVNSRALERGGITAATPDPADGRIERDGACDDILREHAEELARAPRAVDVGDVGPQHERGLARGGKVLQQGRVAG